MKFTFQIWGRKILSNFYRVLYCFMLIDHINRTTTLSVITLSGVHCNNYKTDLLKGILHLNDPFSGRVHGPSCSLMTLFGRPQIFSARNLKNMTQLFLFTHLTVLLFLAHLKLKLIVLKDTKLLLSNLILLLCNSCY